MKHRKKKGRKNPSFAASFSPSSIVKPVFSGARWKNVAAQIGGLTATTAASTFLIGKVSQLQGDGIVQKLGRVGVRLAMAGVAAMVAKKASPKYYDEVLNGGMLSGISYGLQEFFPTYFKGLGEGEDWFDYGLSDYADPRQMANPYGMSDYADPRQMANPYGMSGLRDFADPRQMANPYGLGYQDSLVAEQLAESMI